MAYTWVIFGLYNMVYVYIFIHTICMNNGLYIYTYIKVYMGYEVYDSWNVQGVSRLPQGVSIVAGSNPTVH